MHDPDILPFSLDPDAAESAHDEDGPEEDLETAYRRALAEVDAQLPVGDDAAGPIDGPEPPPAEGDGQGADGKRNDVESVDADPRVHPTEVIEAALFVGGGGLTAARASTLLRGEFGEGYLADAAERLNRRYAAEGRPYRVTRGEDGWRMRLTPAFEPVRRRLYGLGPKEVSLSRDTVEVLAVVAYRQPASRAEVERTREGNAAPALRTLLRLGLIALDRGGEDADDEASGDEASGGPRHVTTGRFLDLFGLTDLHDLPRPEDLSFK